MKQATSINIFILTAILFVIRPCNCYSIGAIGSYNLTGIALSKNGDTLKNQQIIVFCRNKVDTLVTDSNGNYKIKIFWETVCPSGITLWPRRWQNNQINPKYIYFAYNGVKIKIKNDWKSMMSANATYSDSPTKKGDLIF